LDGEPGKCGETSWADGGTVDLCLGPDPV